MTLFKRSRSVRVLVGAGVLAAVVFAGTLIAVVAKRGPGPRAESTESSKDVPPAPPSPAPTNQGGQLRKLVESAAQPGSDDGPFAALCRAAEADWSGFIEEVGNLTGQYAEVVSRVIARQGLSVLPRLVAAVREGRVAVPIATAAVIQIGPDALREVVVLAADPSPALRLWVAACLGGFPDQAVQHLPVLADFLRDPDERVAVQALNTIRPLGSRARPITDAVKAATADQRERVRAAALVVLPGLSEGPDEELRKKLVKEATDPVAPLRTRMAAIESLGRIPASPETLAVLLTAASDSDRSLRSAALDSLTKLGRGVNPIAPQVLKLLTPGQPQNSDAGRLLQILAAIDPPSGLEEVAVKYCSSKSAPERAAALACLLRVPKPNDFTIRAVIERLGDSDTGVRMKAVQLLIPHAERTDVGAALLAAREREQNPHVRRLLASVGSKTPREP